MRISALFRHAGPAACLLVGGLLAGCAHRPPPVLVPPNPFGYLRHAALCSATKPATAPDGLLAAMRIRSDGGLCDLRLSRPEGGAYASFVLSTLPLHGRSFIYNYAGDTYVTYTADLAYAGDDSFVVRLVPAAGRPRTALKVDVAVDATGVVLPKPPAPPPPPAPARSSRRRTHVSRAHSSKAHPGAAHP